MDVGNRLGRAWNCVATILAIAGIAGLAACGASRPIKYYSIDAADSRLTSPGNGQRLPIALLIGHFTGAHLYREDRIVYRTGASQLHTYDTHRWAEPPTEIIENMLLARLRASGHYQTVQSQRSNAHGDYVIRGRLQNFEEVDGPPQVARVTLAVEMYEMSSGTTVWSQTYSADEAISGKMVEATVDALQRDLSRGLTQILSSLDQYFAAHPPK